ncbi:hypothetical protein KAU32_09335 [bacterium]|nr:hypothetical protein [bacterium]
MKKFLSLLLIVFLFFIFIGCDDDNKPPISQDPGTSEISDQSIPEPVYDPSDTETATILAVNPTGIIRSMDGLDEINVVFSKPVVPLKKIKKGEPSLIKITPLLKGEGYWKTSSVYVFRVDDTPEYSTKYSIEFIGTKALPSREWTVSTPGIELSASFPQYNADQIGLDQKIYLEFSLPVDLERFKELITVSSGNQIIPVKMSHPNIKKLSAHYKDWLSYTSNPRGWDSFTYYRVPSFLYAADPDPAKIIELIPQQKYGIGKEVKVSIKLPRGHEYKGKVSERHVPFRTYNHFKVQRIDSAGYPGEGVEIEFTNLVRPAELKGKIKMHPEVEIHLEENLSSVSRSVYIWGKFKPGMEYRITVLAASKDVFGNALDEDHTFTYKVDDYYPQFRLPSGSIVIEDYFDDNFPIYTLNCNKLEMYWKNLSSMELRKYIYKDWYYYEKKDYKKRGFHKLDLVFESPKNIPKLEFLDFNKLENRGIFYTFFFGAHSTAHSLITRTDMGMCASYSDSRLYLYAFDMRTGDGISGIPFKIIDRSGSKFSGTTNKAGMMQYDLKKAQDKFLLRSAMVLSQDKRHPGYLMLSGGGYYYHYGNGYEGLYKKKYLVHTDKNPYNRGETVKFKGILRHTLFGKMELPKIKRIRMTVYDSGGKEVQDITLTAKDITPYGTFTAEYVIPEDARTGGYRAAFNIKSSVGDDRSMHSYFRIEEYKPTNFSVSASFGEEIRFTGDSVELDIISAYQNNIPMSEAEGSVRWTLTTSNFYTSKYSGYTYSWNHEYITKELGKESFTLDGEGKKTINKRINPPFKSPGTITAYITVQDRDRKSVSYTVSKQIYDKKTYIGIKFNEYGIYAEEKFDLGIINVDTKGDTVPAGKFTAEIKKVELIPERKYKDEVYYYTFREELDKCRKDIFNLKTGQHEQKILLKDPGNYELSVKGVSGRKNKVDISRRFTVYEKRIKDPSAEKPKIPRLKADKSSYKVGENIAISVYSPWNNCKVMITAGNEDIYYNTVLDISNETIVHKIKISEDYITGVNITAQIIKPRGKEQTYDIYGTDITKPNIHTLSIDVHVDNSIKRIILDVSSDKEKYNPGETVKLKIKASDHNKKPVKTELCISVVDKGVLDLLGFRFPDPFNFFWGYLDRNVYNMDNIRYLLSKEDFMSFLEGSLDPEFLDQIQGGSHRLGYDKKEKSYRMSAKSVMANDMDMSAEVTAVAEEAIEFEGKQSVAQAPSPMKKAKGSSGSTRNGGDGFSDIALRRIFEESTFYKAYAHTDADGYATLEFPLSDRLSKFIIMVSGVSQKDLFGYGETSIDVKKDLILRESLPNFLRLGDDFEAGVTVTNNTEKTRKIKVIAEVKNLMMKKDQEPIQILKLKAGETKELRWGFLVHQKGETVFTFKATDGEVSDGLERKVKVSDPKFQEAVASFGLVKKGMKELIEVPLDTFHEFDKLELSLSSTAMVGLKRNFELLREYPYSCLEQKLSSIYPLVTSQDLLIEFKLSKLSRAAMGKQIKKLLKEVGKFQASSGGFKYYPDSLYESPWLTAYTLEFLFHARSRDYKVDKDVVDRGLAYLQSYVNSYSVDTKYPYSRAVVYSTVSYAHYIVSLYKKTSPTVMEKLYKVRDRLPLSSVLYLYKSLSVYGADTAKKHDVLNDILFNKVKVDPTTAHFENQEDPDWWWIHESNIRTTATILYGMLEAKGKFPLAEKAARWLTEATKQKRYISTQENIRLFQAFEKYYKIYEAETPDFVIEAMINSKVIAKEKFKGRDVEVRFTQLMLSEYKPGEMLKLTFNKKGPGQPYYLLRMKYFPKGELPSIDRGFEVIREYKPLDGSEWKGYFEAGKKYLVEITVKNTQERHFVMLNDYLPAGLRVLNPAFRTTSPKDLQKTNRGSWWGSWWGGFYRSEIYFDSVKVFAEYLRAGTHKWTYLVESTNYGKFTAPGTYVEEMYNQEVFGRSEKKILDVR